MLNQLWMAVGAKKGDIINGALYLPAGVESNKILSVEAKSETLAAELWEWTEKALEKF